MLLKQLYVILKVTQKCNLDCTYCYESRGECKHMTEAISLRSMEELTRISENLVIILHGGEPLMAGLSFFNILLKAGNKKQDECKITYHIQTNGTLINRQWIEIFKENKISVGISMDGPQLVHDKFRLTTNGKGTFNQVHNHVKSVEKEGLELNCLCVITSKSLVNIFAIFDFFEASSFKMIDFIPCIMEKNSRNSQREDMTISPKEYAAFITQYFDLWKKSDQKYTVRSFTDFMSILNGEESQTCMLLYPKVCGINVIAIDTNGDVYPCDSFAGQVEMCMGNIANGGLNEILSNSKLKTFVETANGIPEDCGSCRFLKYCFGGCVYHRYFVSKDLKNKSFYCEANKRIFKYITNYQ